MIFRRFTPEYLLRILLALIISVIIWSILSGRNRQSSYFSTRCIDYNQRDYSRRLNDRIVDYSASAKLSGITASSNEKELRKKISEGKLVKVRSGRLYTIDRMTYSSPCLTKDSKELLDEIARRFRMKTSDKGLNGAKLYITSMTRKKDSLKILRRNNGNSSANSPHLYGNAFDISYKRFSARKMVLTNCDRKFMKDALGEVIFELRNDKKCWATYERMQSCFHVVSR